MTIVATRAGTVRGTYTDGVHTFRGIPYAQPPVGRLRFAASVPHAPWDGILDANEFGALRHRSRCASHHPTSG